LLNPSSLYGKGTFTRGRGYSCVRKRRGRVSKRGKKKKNSLPKEGRKKGALGRGEGGMGSLSEFNIEARGGIILAVATENNLQIHRKGGRTRKSRWVKVNSGKGGERGKFFYIIRQVMKSAGSSIWKKGCGLLS